MGIKIRIRHKQTDAEFCFLFISCKGYVQNSLLEDGLNLETFSREFIFDSLSEVSLSKGWGLQRSFIESTKFRAVWIALCVGNFAQIGHRRCT